MVFALAGDSTTTTAMGHLLRRRPARGGLDVPRGADCQPTRGIDAGGECGAGAPHSGSRARWLLVQPALVLELRRLLQRLAGGVGHGRPALATFVGVDRDRARIDDDVMLAHAQ